MQRIYLKIEDGSWVVVGSEFTLTTVEIDSGERASDIRGTEFDFNSRDVILKLNGQDVRTQRVNTDEYAELDAAVASHEQSMKKYLAAAIDRAEAYLLSGDGSVLIRWDNAQYEVDRLS